MSWSRLLAWISLSLGYSEQGVGHHGHEASESAPWFGLQLEGCSHPNKLDANDGASTVLT